MDDDDLRAEIARLAPWHHNLELGPGIWTGARQPQGSWPPEMGTPELLRPDLAFANLASQLWPGGLERRTFLDCACNAGGYLFAAKAHGAARGFGFDVREHWIRQARFLAARLPSEGLEFAVMDLAELEAMPPERFDVTWFNGIFYHLPDPIAGLRAAADRTGELIIVNTEVMPAPVSALVLKKEDRDQLMSGVHGLAWAPSDDRVVAEILAWCGFPHSRLRFDISGAVGRRIQLLAARDEAAFVHYDRVMPKRPPATRKGLVERLLRRRSAS